MFQNVKFSVTRVTLLNNSNTTFQPSSTISTSILALPQIPLSHNYPKTPPTRFLLGSAVTQNTFKPTSKTFKTMLNFFPVASPDPMNFYENPTKP